MFSKANAFAFTILTMKKQNVALCCYLGVLGHEPRSKLLAAVAERAVDTAHGFRAPDIVNMLWAYARWHRRFAPGGAPGSAEVVAALSANALSSLASFTPYQCANLAWSLAMLDAPLPVGVFSYFSLTFFHLD